MASLDALFSGGWTSLGNGTTATRGINPGGENGNIWLIDRKTRKQTVLSTGHFMAPDHQHPSFSPDGNRILIQSGMLTGGQRLALVVMPSDPALTKPWN